MHFSWVFVFSPLSPNYIKVPSGLFGCHCLLEAAVCSVINPERGQKGEIAQNIMYSNLI